MADADLSVEQFDKWLSELDGYIGRVERSRPESAKPFYLVVDGRFFLSEEQATKLEDLWENHA